MIITGGMLLLGMDISCPVCSPISVMMVCGCGWCGDGVWVWCGDRGVEIVGQGV